MTAELRILLLHGLLHLLGYDHETSEEDMIEVRLVSTNPYQFLPSGIFCLIAEVANRISSFPVYGVCAAENEDGRS